MRNFVPVQHLHEQNQQKYSIIMSKNLSDIICKMDVVDDGHILFQHFRHSELDRLESSQLRQEN